MLGNAGLLCCLLSVRAVLADDNASAAAEPMVMDAIQIEPSSVVLDHARARVKMVVTGVQGSHQRDVSGQATWELASEGIVGRDGLELAPLAEGKTELVARVGSAEARILVEVRGLGEPRSVSFDNEVQPILSKLSCNSGGCHGKSGGQNGFRLSLLAYKPEADYAAIVKEGRGRRIFPASPAHSLLLRKATGELPHGGGKRMTRGDHDHQLIADWIRQGMPHQPDDPKVVKIAVFPDARVMTKRSSQELRVVATYSDGRQADVTRQVQFQSNDEAVAKVNDGSKVMTLDQSGEAAIMARYMGQVAVYRASVPVGKTLPDKIEFTAANPIDELTAKKWKDLGLVPSRRTTDAEFARRLYIDMVGRLPLPVEVTSFVTSTDPDKRNLLIDQLLDSRGFAAHFAMKWGAVLQNKRAGRADYAPGTHAMSLWLKDAFHRDMPYDQFVRAILTATGTPTDNPPVTWYRQVRSPQQNVDNVSQLFLGTRIQCAQCHHHPFEKWSQDDYFSLAAFFARVGRKPFENSDVGEPTEAVFVARSGKVTHPLTEVVMKPAGLDGPKLDIPAGDDPRRQLADWMIDPANPFFARALANRVWGHFFKRGIVEPIDDMRVTNPPTNPELLDWLAADVREHGWSLKHMVRTIVRSSTYQLASEPNEFNKQDSQNFARFYPRRLPAEVLLDAIDVVTQARTAFDFPEEMRAVDLPDEQINSYFLDIFGRPQRQSSCECERTTDANLSQSLHLLNSPEIQAKLTADSSQASKLAADPRPDEEKVRELYLMFFSRLPTAEEAKVAGDYLSQRSDKKQAYQNLLWALINTKEFQFNT
jgi:hypothetical protein